MFPCIAPPRQHTFGPISDAAVPLYSSLFSRPLPLPPFLLPQATYFLLCNSRRLVPPSSPNTLSSSASLNIFIITSVQIYFCLGLHSGRQRLNTQRLVKHCSASLHPHSKPVGSSSPLSQWLSIWLLLQPWLYPPVNRLHRWVARGSGIMPT